MYDFVCFFGFSFNNNRGKGFCLATGYKITEPSGVVRILTAESREEINAEALAL